MKMKEYIILFYNAGDIKMTYHKDQREKAQGIVEYALILAFVVGVAVALFNSNGLADAIGKAFYEVSETINNAIDDSPEAKRTRTQNMLADALKKAIIRGDIKMQNGDWVEIDTQQAKNANIDGYVDGGGNRDSSTLIVNGKVYKNTNFKDLWNVVGIENYKVGYKQDSGWTGVRIESKGNDSYVVHYYNGSESGPGKIPKYADTAYMNSIYESDSNPSTTWDGK